MYSQRNNPSTNFGENLFGFSHGAYSPAFTLYLLVRTFQYVENNGFIIHLLNLANVKHFLAVFLLFYFILNECREQN